MSLDPRTVPPRNDRTAEGDRNRESTVANGWLLVAEDSPSQALHLSALLEAHGYEIAVARNGLEALALLADRVPDVVLSDVVMPVMDGYELCRRIKADSRLAAVPVLLVTSLSDPGDVVKALECGADDFIVKPYVEENLVARVAFNLANRQLHAADRPEIGVEVFFAGRRHFIGSGRLQILNLLLSTYETAVFRNLELEQTRAELEVANESLEERVAERTAALTAEIEVRTRAERRNELARDVLSLLNRSEAPASAIRDIITLIREHTGFEAVGIRLRVGDDFPYVETNGFTDEFVDVASSLCERDEDGSIARDTQGKPVLACMCGNVICGRTDPGLPFFTVGGSFWSNCTTDLLASTSDRNLQSGTRTRCNAEGYESVALIPLRAGGEIIGLLQLNDRHPGRFTQDRIHFFEGLAASIGIALARKLAEDRYRVLFESSQDAIMTVAPPSWLFTSGNPAALEMFGATSKEEFLSCGPSVLSPERQEDGRESGDKSREMIESALREGSHFFEWTHRRLDGKTFPATVLLSRMQTAGEVFLQATVRDISEQKRAEKALALIQERFRGFVENAQIGVYRTTPDGKIVMANPKMAVIMGFPSPEALMAENLEDWAGVGLLDRAEFRTRIEKDGLVSGLERTLTRPDGSVIHIREHARVVRTQAGAPLFYEGTIEDLTEQKALEAQLRHSQKMDAVGNLAGGVAHDFNNVLQAMLSQVQALASHQGRPEEVAGVVGELEAQVKRGAALTRQLLLFSRREKTTIERLHLNDVVTSTLTMLRRLVPGDVAFDVELAEEPLAIDGDRGQLEQVLTNLVVNASHAMPDGGTLRIRTARQGAGSVCLAVEDSGCGIPEEIRQRIFEPFFTTRAGEHGTGLGLSVVLGIVTQHGGRIDLDSAVGEGSTFRIVLPISTAPARQVGKPAAAAEEIASGGTGERVLVVEDEAGARDGLRDILGALGYQVVAVGSGEEAGRLPPEPAFDVLLTDLMLPDVRGTDLARGLLERWPQLKVILMSGYSEDEAVRRGAGDGTVRFLQKPFDMDTLAREVRAALAADVVDTGPRPARMSVVGIGEGRS